MNKRLFAFLFSVIASIASYAQQNSEAEVKAAIERFYRVLSFSDTNAMHIDSLSLLFTKDGSITANYDKQPTSWTPAAFVSWIRETVRSQQMTRRFERDVSSKTEIFGSIAQVFSTYELTMQLKGQTVVRRGINGIQLLKINGTWFIFSLIWDRESNSNPLPLKYLQ